MFVTCFNSSLRMPVEQCAWWVPACMVGCLVKSERVDCSHVRLQEFHTSTVCTFKTTEVTHPTVRPPFAFHSTRPTLPISLLVSLLKFVLIAGFASLADDRLHFVVRSQLQEGFLRCCLMKEIKKILSRLCG